MGGVRWDGHGHPILPAEPIPWNGDGIGDGPSFPRQRWGGMMGVRWGYGWIGSGLDGSGTDMGGESAHRWGGSLGSHHGMGVRRAGIWDGIRDGRAVPIPIHG